jgi:hypothetical protein
MQRIIITVITIFLILYDIPSKVLYGQEGTQIRQVIPPSPTVASLAKYGDLPISIYTGTPNISIPIHEIKTTDFVLPISLSYHASGIKVEEMASWVGLGWSLNAGGIISRTVNGIPDEINGYMNPGTGQRIVDILALPIQQQEEIYRWTAQGNYPDLEPDIFNFNFGTYSGKFFFSQETQEFVCIPQKSISIDKQHFLTTGKWKIKTEDGTEYHFELKEENTRFVSCGGSAGSPTVSITGWFLTKIITPTAKQEIILNYDPAQYTIKNISSHTLDAMPAGIAQIPCVKPLQICDSQNSYNGYRLKSITYPTGRIDFKANTNRQDLLGDKRLDLIEVFRFNETESSKSFRLTYDYFNANLIGTNPNLEQLSFMLRLKLSSVFEVGEFGNELPPYSFSYQDQIPMPSRMSYDQDNWGFYNGPKNNAHLIPPMRELEYIHPGSDRHVDDTFTGIGVLNKIYYPTGGFTTFEYENHLVKGSIPYAEDEFRPLNAYLDATDACSLGSTDVFCENVLVNDEKTDGVFMSIIISEIFNCDQCPNGLPNAQTCAILTLQSPTFTLPITCDVTNIFVPNGNYVLKANFSNNTNVSNYQNFVIQLTWKEYIAPPPNSKVGGLRIKKMTDDDGMQHTKSKYFTYFDTSTDECTGVLVSRSPVYEYSQPCTATGEGVSGPYIIRTSYSNIPLGTTQGSHVGYHQVSVTNEANGLIGKTVYYYSDARHHPDYYSEEQASVQSLLYCNEYPFAPASNFDHRRGLLLKQEDFNWNGSTFVLIKKVVNEYRPLDILVDYPERYTEPLHSAAKGIKTGTWGSIENGNNSGLYALHSVYSVVSEWIRQTKTSEYLYSPSGEFVVVSTTDFSNTSHKQPTSIKVVQSDGVENTTYFRYPLDFAGIPSSPSDPSVIGIKRLRDDHFITNVIEKYNTEKIPGGVEKVLDGSLTTYKANQPLPDEIFVLKSVQPKPISNFITSYINGLGNFVKDIDYETRLKLLQYDGLGNLLAQKKDQDVLYSYLWGYNSYYPIAQIVNAQPTEVFHTSFEESIANTSTIAKTGVKSFAAAYTVVLPSTGAFKLTYWRKVGSSDWEFMETTISANQVIGGTGILIDEVRVYPSNAQMTTFTYKQGLGLASMNDPNNSIVYYEYDVFGRLKLIRDNAGNIIQSYLYNYKN